MCVSDVFCGTNVMYVTLQSYILTKHSIKVKRVSFHNDLKVVKALFCFACGRTGGGVFGITLNFFFLRERSVWENTLKWSMSITLPMAILLALLGR